MATALEFLTLGPIHLRSDAADPVDSVLRQPRLLAVLAFLATGVEARRTRDEVLSLLWADTPLDRARHSLNQTIYELRRVLGDAIVTRGAGDVGLDSGRLWCDVQDLLSAARRGDHAQVAELWRGEFLPGFSVPDAPVEFEHWLDAERSHLRGLAVAAMLAVANQAAAGDRTDDVVRWARRAAAVAPLDEALARRVMEVMVAGGNAAAALAHYREFEGRLARELELEPSADLRKWLRHVEAAPPKPIADRTVAVRANASSAPPALPASPGEGPAPTRAAPSSAEGTGGTHRRVRRSPVLMASAVGLAAVVVIAGAVTVSRWLRPAGNAPRYPRTAIAVLPFDNQSGEGPHAFFAGGLQDELLTQLTKVAALKVIGRTSVMGYAGTTKRLSEIGDELAVGSLVEGSVQVIGDRLRVNVQLIDPATEGQLWAERYDRTLDDAFAVQSDIAQQIVAAVGAALARSEQQALAASPTTNAEAYLLYLQGLDYYYRPGGPLWRNWEIAQDLLERAVALDTTFALAYAALSQIHGRMSWFRYDPSPERLVRQRETAEIALGLAPNLPQAHRAMGTVNLYGRQDWRAALREYQIALTGLPNDAELWWWIGLAQRHLGNWKEALTAMDRAVALDPRNTDALFEGGQSLQLLHRYQEAVAWYDRALALTPDVAGADMRRAWAWVRWQGRLDSLRAVLDRHPPETRLVAWGSATAERALLFLWERNADSLLALLRRTASTVFDGQVLYLPTELYAAWAHDLRGEHALAHTAFDSARAFLDSVAAVLPRDWRVHAARGLALAGLGRSQEARREAQWLEASTIYRNDMEDGVHPAEDRARILAGIGDADDALAEIERLLAGPSLLTVHTLRLDPRWDPIRDDPRFQALLVKYDPPQPVR